MDTRVFSCCGTRTNSQEKPSICISENGLDLSTLDSLQSFFILSVIFLKDLTASPQVSSRSESRHSKWQNLKFRTIKHQCPDSSLGFMVATNDGGSNVGKRSWKKIAEEKWIYQIIMKQKIQPPNNKIKEGNWHSQVETKNHIIIKKLYPLPKIEEQSYQFNSLATISTALIKEA